MRVYLMASAAALLLFGCSEEQPKRAAEDLRTFDVREAPPVSPAPPPMAPPPTVSAATPSRQSADGAGPDIGVTSAPGVAFNYRYAYRLANARIQAAQEAHAQMCEKLTVSRCRITGMRYSLVNERDIAASLELKLDPSIARQFGKDATKVITDAEGMLVDQQISGVDMAPTIEGADRGRAALQDDLDRVNRELSRPGLSNIIRERLLTEAAQLRDRIRALGAQKQNAEDSLATTPMMFVYGSGATVPGFDEERPIATAFARAGLAFERAAAFLIVAGATLLPWAVMIALFVWLWRLFRVGAWLSRKSDEAFARELAEP